MLENAGAKVIPASALSPSTSAAAGSRRSRSGSLSWLPGEQLKNAPLAPINSYLMEGGIMDIGGVTSAVPGVASTQTNDAVGLAVLKKAMDIDAASAVALINAIPATPNLPPHLGQNINTTA